MIPPVPPQEHTRLIDTLLNAHSKGARRQAARTLSAMPDRDAVATLIAALQTANSQHSFRAVARLLAARPTDEAVEELHRQVRENRRFPNIPVSSLALSSHPRALPLLVQIMEQGRAKQRRTAMDALATLRSARVIEPLCRAAGRQGVDGHYARSVLLKMGRPARLARRALEDSELSASDCSRTIESLEILPEYVFPLSFTYFKSERYLLRAVEKPGPLQARALAVLERLRERQTLLRAGSAAEQDNLLRPAKRGPGASRDLLRSSDAPTEPVPSVRAAWWRFRKK